MAPLNYGAKKLLTMWGGVAGELRAVLFPARDRVAGSVAGTMVHILFAQKCGYMVLSGHDN